MNDSFKCLVCGKLLTEQNSINWEFCKKHEMALGTSEEFFKSIIDSKAIDPLHNLCKNNDDKTENPVLNDEKRQPKENEITTVNEKPENIQKKPSKKSKINQQSSKDLKTTKSISRIEILKRKITQYEKKFKKAPKKQKEALKILINTNKKRLKALMDEKKKKKQKSLASFV